MSRIDELISELCPAGIEFKSLGELGTTYGGLTGKDKGDFSNGNARFISYRNVFNNIAVNLELNDLVRVGPSENQNYLTLGDVLFTGSSETPDEVGMSSVVVDEPSKTIYLNSFCFGYRFNDCALLLPEFSKYVFRSDTVRQQIVMSASGVTRFNISKKRFLKVRIPILPAEVQRKIVNVLDTFTELEANLEAELRARRRQYQYYRDALLNFDVVREGVRWMTLGEIGKVSMCKRVFKDETTSEGDIPFYKIGTFGGTPDAFISKELYEGYRSRYSFPKNGDVLISAAGTIGRAIPYDGEDAYFQDSNIVWIDNDGSLATNRYLWHWYQIVDWVTDGGTIRRLYNENLRQTRIAVPPLEEQARIVAILDRFDALVNDLTSGLPAEIAARRQQYEHYRDRLLTFREAA